MLEQKILKALEAKDQDVQKGGTKTKQGELLGIVEFDEVASGRNWRRRNTLCGKYICIDTKTSNISVDEREAGTQSDNVGDCISPKLYRV